MQILSISCAKRRAGAAGGAGPAAADRHGHPVRFSGGAAGARGMVGGAGGSAAGGGAAGLRQPHRRLVHLLQGERGAGAGHRAGAAGLRRAAGGHAGRRLDARRPGDHRAAAGPGAGRRAALPALPGWRWRADVAAADPDRGRAARGAGRALIRS